MQYTDILEYWYSDRLRKHWFASTPELDREIRVRFEPVWERAAAGELDHWQEAPEGALALIIVLDQLPLNMFRGEPKSFQTERKAVEVAIQAINQGYDDEISKDKLMFLFMPLMHSEDLAEQDLSVECYRKHGLSENLRFAEHHRDIIRTCGRFPRRNAIMGRINTAAEDEYLRSDKAFKG